MDTANCQGCVLCGLAASTAARSGLRLPSRSVPRHSSHERYAGPVAPAKTHARRVSREHAISASTRPVVRRRRRAPWSSRRSRSRCRSPRGVSSAVSPRSSPASTADASQTALLVAVPVLLGSLARLPMGMLTDRSAGASCSPRCSAFSSLAAFVVPLTASYGSLLVAAFLDRHGRLVVRGRRGLRVALDARPPGKARPSASTGWARWASRSPCSSARSWRRAGLGERCFAAPARCSCVWAVVYFLLARNPAAGRHVPPRSRAMIAVLRRAPTAWLLGAFYFLTFGGFVAFSIYLPTLLRAQFGLAPADAGFRAAGFVVLATLMRPARRLAGGPDRRRPGAVVGVRRRRRCSRCC